MAAGGAPVATVRSLSLFCLRPAGHTFNLPTLQCLPSVSSPASSTAVGTAAGVPVVGAAVERGHAALGYRGPCCATMCVRVGLG